MADLRRELPKRFPQLQFFFQPADIVNQVLNFGQPAPIDIRVSGPKDEEAYATATKLARDLNSVPGVVDSHIFQVPDAPALTVDVDRAMAREVGIGQQTIASDVLVSLNNSLQVSPNFWLNPRNGVSYPLVVQTPTYQINDAQDLWTLPVTAPRGEGSAASDERREVRPGQGSDGPVAAQYQARFRRARRCPGNRSEHGGQAPSKR